MQPQPGIAWILIALITSFIALGVWIGGDEAQGTEIEPAAAELVEEAPKTDVEQEIQAKVLLGQITLMPSDTPLEPLLENTDAMQRLRGIVMLSVLDRERATLMAKALRMELDAAAPNAELVHSVLQILQGDDTAEDGNRAKAELGPFAPILWSACVDQDALRALQERAVRAVMMIVAGLLVVGVSALVGLVLCIIALVRVRAGTMRSALTERSVQHGLYAETFVAWLIVFNLLSIVAAEGARALACSPFSLLAVAFPLSLVALAWPSWRGSSLSRTRQDIGLHCGKGLVRELAAGVVGWMCMLPIQGIGLLITLMFMSMAGVVEGDADAPSHPIVEVLGDPAAIALSLIVAVVMAPLVEETVFRGLLYRQLRSVGKLGRGAVSCVSSAFITGFVFAAVHPQGWMGVPALMGIAIAIALAREWRGSLIAPMVMHGINNGLAMTALLVLLYA